MPRVAKNTQQSPEEIAKAQLLSALGHLHQARVAVAGGAEMFAPEDMATYNTLQTDRSNIVATEMHIREILDRFNVAPVAENHAAVAEPATTKAVK